MSLATVVDLYRLLLQPIPPFTWFGSPLSMLDVAATVRLCMVMRQLRGANLASYRQQRQNRITGSEKNAIEDADSGLDNKSLVKDLTATLIVVYAGEAITGPFLGVTPSFMASGVVPALYVAVQAFVEYIPTSMVPPMTLHSELPISFLDALTRAYLLCTLIPPAVVNHISPALSTSPWTLLLTSLITANAGFLIVNALSFLAPTPLALTTPPELAAYGWTTADLWCAPLGTAIYALLTQAQPPFVALAGAVGLGATDENGVQQPLDAETARAAVAVGLALLFSTRAVKNFGAEYTKSLRAKRNVRVVSRHGQSRNVGTVGKIKTQ